MNTDYSQFLPNYKTGTYNMAESGFPCVFTTKDNRPGLFLQALRNTVCGDRRLVFVDGRAFVASINWIRDHVHEMRAFMHWEHDLTGFWQFILDSQSSEGWFYELVKQLDDPHWQFVHPEYTKLFPKDNVAATRLEIEADVEYLMVQGAVQILQATGNEELIRSALPSLEKGIRYMITDPNRWDSEHGLIKRAFTIDTWDFVYGKPNTDRRLEADTPMSLMHGDSTGVYAAMRSLATLNRRFGAPEKAAEWDRLADTLKENVLKNLWNGKFFIHQVHLNHNGADALEGERLSLSNAYDLNRGILTHAQARAVLDEYARRKDSSGSFAEWFSIDPPYEQFGNAGKGKYVNGGIASYCAGELARAAFAFGREAYGLDILKRLAGLIRRDGELFFLYDPASGENLGGGPSGWGAAAALAAFEEGLAGIRDKDVLFRRLEFSPRWVLTEYDHLLYRTGYEAGKVMLRTEWFREGDLLRILLEAPSEEIRCHVLLPEGSTCGSVTVNGHAVDFENTREDRSPYADFTLTAPPSERDSLGWMKNREYELRVQMR